MNFFKKSLGQNFLIEKNIINKILDLSDINNKDIIEIGPGKGALTSEILKRNPKSLLLIEKDQKLSEDLYSKFSRYKNIKLINDDILKINLSEFKMKNTTVFGNLPYNISSQILIKFLKEKHVEKKYNNLIFMFQKELGDKIIAKYNSKNYGRISVIANYNLNMTKKFLVSANCFFPKPKVTSMVIHFKTFKNNKFKIKNISNLEKITKIIFSNRRKMIKKNIEKVLNRDKLNKLPELNTSHRAEDLSPEIYYKITELFEK